MIIIILSGLSTQSQTTQVFTSSGTFTVPAGVTLIKVQCWGGGGGGGHGGSSGNGMNGGGGGAYSAKEFSVTPGALYTVTVGAAGAGGTSNSSPGTIGGNTIFGSNVVVAAGGGVSNSENISALGGQSSSCIGDLKYSGGNGGKGNTSNHGGGGGGGSSGSSAGAGVNGTTPTGSTGGAGGNGLNGDGGTGGDNSGGATASAGTAPGGGGGGQGDSNGNSANGAKGQVVVSWTICPSGSPVPSASISANYCLVPGYIRLYANGGGAGDTYVWNTNETTSTIDVNIAGRYSVTITNTYGCSSTASYDISTELVVDGSFTNFNATSPSFTTEYTQQQSYYSGTTTSGLWPEGYYAVNTDAHYYSATSIGYHPSFYGKDHTNNSPGARKFMMVNGSTTMINGNQRVIWQQTVTVQPNTNYYFSAWGMNLNPGNPATLQFEVNGVLVGTSADLSLAPKPAAEGDVALSNWVQFYSTSDWNSGSSTTAVLRIRNLNLLPNGNDFGLDDISFATLAPVPVNISLPPTMSVCEASTLNLSPSLTGGKEPYTYTWTCVANGFSSNLLNLSISNMSASKAGVYQLSVTDGYGCDPVTASTTVTVNPLPSCSISGADTFCPESTNIIYTGSAGMNSYVWSIAGNGAIIGSTTGANVNITAGANHSNPFTLSLTVTDGNGCNSTCQKEAIVEKISPTFSMPDPFTACVEILYRAVYNPATIDINPNRPDYCVFVKGNTMLDITGITDNCCSPSTLTINWHIDFDGGSPVPISGTGQPSTYSSDIQLPGNGAGLISNHTITYIVTDCNGNTNTQSQLIKVKPRPQITLIY
ncbi:MAG: glycine-rich domain-containing protein [Mariniphaga sp.]